MTSFMLRLRPYKNCDAKEIVTWCKDKIAFRKWSADRFPSFPLTADEMNSKYNDCNGDCAEPDNFYPMTAFDADGIVGHLIMRFVDEEKRILRFGFVIVDDAKRGKGYGKEMLTLALKFAFDILKADKVSIGVFENNPTAYHCYKAAGFQDVELPEKEYVRIDGEDWNCLELEISR